MVIVCCCSVFIFDVYLGMFDCKVCYLFDFLCQLCCEWLYLVGDIIDLEVLGKCMWWYVDYGVVIVEVLDMVCCGVEVIYILGNYDVVLCGLVGQDFGGVWIVLDVVYEGVDGCCYWVSYGDEFDFEQIGCGWMLYLGEVMYCFICWSNCCVNVWCWCMDMFYLLLLIIVKLYVCKVLVYICVYEQCVVDDVCEWGFDGYICGYIYFGQVCDVDGVFYFNDGDWVEYCIVLVEDYIGVMELIYWSEQFIVLGCVSCELVLFLLVVVLVLVLLVCCWCDLGELWLVV